MQLSYVDLHEPLKPFNKLSGSATSSFLTTVVGDNINIMKTTFELNFDFYQAFKQHGYTNMKTKRSCQFKKLHFNYL